MEKKARKKRQKNIPAQENPGTVQRAGNESSKTHSVLGIPLNPETARQAIILSEVIGKPVSKRGSRR